MKFIEGDINLVDKQLTELPKLQNVTVQGYFDCSNNLLTSLEGCPEIIEGHFYCGDNKLVSLDGCPSIVKKNFYCSYNSKNFTREEVESLCNVHGRIFV